MAVTVQYTSALIQTYVRTVKINKLDIERSSVGLTLGISVGLDSCLDYVLFVVTVSEHCNADGSNCNSVTCQQK